MRQWDRSRDGIVSARAERMAAADALHAHPASFDKAVALDGFFSVARAGRLVAAHGGHVLKRHPVGSNQEHSNSLAHLSFIDTNIVAISVESSEKALSAAFSPSARM